MIYQIGPVSSLPVFDIWSTIFESFFYQLMSNFSLNFKLVKNLKTANQK
jgi:hypothetical protein